ncbi:MAG: hypothetical protein AB7Q16_25155, partial [Vicinamibacterales bacterium]
RRGASLIVLFVLAGAPAVGAACAELCDSLANGPASAHHVMADGDHGAMSDCHGAEAPAGASALTSLPCDHHDDAGMSAAFLTASREDARIQLAQAQCLTPTPASGSTTVVAMRRPNPQPTPPRPTAAPLALRI